MDIKVAIVEDNDEIREGLSVLIDDSEGYHCTATYPSAEEALKYLPAHKPDIVLMDIRGSRVSATFRRVRGTLSRQHLSTARGISMWATSGHSRSSKGARVSTGFPAMDRSTCGRRDLPRFSDLPSIGKGDCTSWKRRPAVHSPLPEPAPSCF